MRIHADNSLAWIPNHNFAGFWSDIQRIYVYRVWIFNRR